MTDEQLAEVWKNIGPWMEGSAISPLLLAYGRAVALAAVEAERQSRAIPEDRAALAEELKGAIRQAISDAESAAHDLSGAMERRAADESWREASAIVDRLAASPPVTQGEYARGYDDGFIVGSQKAPTYVENQQLRERAEAAEAQVAEWREDVEAIREDNTMLARKVIAADAYLREVAALAYRALDDAARVLLTIDPEDAEEGERLEVLTKRCTDVSVSLFTLLRLPITEAPVMAGVLSQEPTP